MLIVVGKDKLQAELDKAGLKAHKQLEKQIDMDRKELDKEIGEAKSSSSGRVLACPAAIVRVHDCGGAGPTAFAERCDLGAEADGRMRRAATGPLARS